MARRPPLTSRSARLAAPTGPAAAQAPRAGAEAEADTRTTAAMPWRQRWAAWVLKHERWCWASAALGLALLAGWPAWRATPAPAWTLQQIDAAVRESFAKEPPPAATAAAAAAVAPSVVRVVGEADEGSDQPRPSQKSRPGRSALPEGHPPLGPADGAGPHHGGRSVGTGVVIVQSGLILTNLHVVQGARRIQVTFSDGSDSEASVVSTQPEHDLAVLRAHTLPDDLQPATLRSTQGLVPGDAVVAVGFPFGIGPSASAGVISGLKREFRSPRGDQRLGNLIQFDAAANPGNSGGPLVTLDGHVVGIVTAIMNPEGHSTFIGIGFAVPIENAAAGVGMPPF